MHLSGENELSVWHSKCRNIPRYFVSRFKQGRFLNWIVFEIINSKRNWKYVCNFDLVFKFCLPPSLILIKAVILGKKNTCHIDNPT